VLSSPLEIGLPHLVAPLVSYYDWGGGSEDRLATDSTDRFPVAYKDWRSIRLVTSVLITSYSPAGVGFVGVGRDATLFPQGVRAAVVYSTKRIRPAYHSIKLNERVESGFLSSMHSTEATRAPFL